MLEEAHSAGDASALALPENLSLPHFLQLAATVLGQKVKGKEGKEGDAARRFLKVVAKMDPGTEEFFLRQQVFTLYLSRLNANVSCYESYLASRTPKPEDQKPESVLFAKPVRVSEQAGGCCPQGFMQELVAKLVGRGNHLEAARLLSGEGMHKVRATCPPFHCLPNRSSAPKKQHLPGLDTIVLRNLFGLVTIVVQNSFEPGSRSSQTLHGSVR